MANPLPEHLRDGFSSMLGAARRLAESRAQSAEHQADLLLGIGDDRAWDRAAEALLARREVEEVCALQAAFDELNRTLEGVE